MGTKEDTTKKKKSIMRKFIRGILIPLIVILVITGIVLNLCLTREIETLQERSLQTETESASRLIERYFEDYFSIIETTAALPVVQEALLEISQNGESFRESPYHDEIVEILVEIQKLSPRAIRSLYITDFATSQYLRWDGKTPEPGWDITTRPYYPLVNEAGRTILTPVFKNVAGVTVVSVCTPVFDPESGEILGSVNIDLGLYNLIASMDAIHVGEDGYIILFDSMNNVVSARSSRRQLLDAATAGFSEELIDRINNNEGGNVEFEFEGVSYHGNLREVRELDGWCVLGVMPETEYHQPITSITIVVIICFVLCSFILAVLCMLVVRKIIQPVQKLSEIVGELAEGNLYVECNMQGEDEIGHLAEGVRVLVDRLQTYMLYVSESYEKMEDLAFTDALTGLGSRMAFNRQLKECSQMESVGCVVADVNNLKLCNDKYGHSEGDKIITDAADCICGAFEEIGTCYRIGGDEFCVLIADSTKEQIKAALERVDALITEKNVSRKLPLSVAFGYAVRESLKESVEEVFNRGDEMMYDTKSRMKKEFSVYREEKIANYLKALRILKKSTDDYLFLWDIGRDEIWFFDDVDCEYDVHVDGKPTITTEEMKRFVHPADYKKFLEEMENVENGTKMEINLNYRWENKRGELVWVNCRGQVINDDKGNQFCMIGRVSDQMLRYLYNPLTKLFNKEKLWKDFARGKIANGYFVLVSVDNMNGINLEYSSNYGDQVIKKCAEVIENSGLVRQMWHTEGNCFALDLAATTKVEVRQIYDDLAEQLSEICTISAGAVPEDGEWMKSAQNLYDGAEKALEQAKAAGMQILMFHENADAEAEEKEQL